MSRPFELDPLFRALTILPGIGPRNSQHLQRLVQGPKIWDLLCHLPIDFIDRSHTPLLSQAKPGEIATLSLQVVNHIPNAKRNLPYRIACKDQTGIIQLIFFHANKDWLFKQFPNGSQIVVSGKIETYNGKLQMVHPDSSGRAEDLSQIAKIEAIYALTSGITNKTVTKSGRFTLATDNKMSTTLVTVVSNMLWILEKFLSGFI